MSTNKISMPSNDTLSQAAKLSIKVSKPICFYFYIDSCKNNALLMFKLSLKCLSQRKYQRSLRNYLIEIKGNKCILYNQYFPIKDKIM